MLEAFQCEGVSPHEATWGDRREEQRQHPDERDHPHQYTVHHVRSEGFGSMVEDHPAKNRIRQVDELGVEVVVEGYLAPRPSDR